MCDPAVVREVLQQQLKFWMEGFWSTWHAATAQGVVTLMVVLFCQNNLIVVFAGGIAAGQHTGQHCACHTRFASAHAVRHTSSNPAIPGTCWPTFDPPSPLVPQLPM